MSSMRSAIRDTFLSESKIALASFFPAGDVLGYFSHQFDTGTPLTYMGQFFCAINRIKSRTGPKNIPGNSYVNELWSVCVTITTRSSYAPDMRIDDPMDFHDQLTRAITSRYNDNQWVVMAAINTLFNADHASTNGLTTPFLISEPFPERQQQPNSWLGARNSKKSTSQINSFSSTIRFTDALHIQALGNVA